MTTTEQWPDLATLLRQQARQRGDATMAIFPADGTFLSYNDLYTGSVRWMGEFIDWGLGVGDRLTIVSRKSSNFLVAYFGALLAGITVHVVDDQIDAKDMDHALSLFAPDALLGDDFGARRLGDTAWVHRLQELVPASALVERAYAEATSLPGDTAAICVFTSGSTGDPKGILSSHANLLFAASCLSVHELRPDDRVLGLTPLSGTNGQVFSLWAPLVSGGSAVFYQGMFSPFTALEWAAEHRATWMNGTPTYLSLFLTHRVDRSEFDLHTLRFYRSASAPLPASVQKDFEGHYGISIIETMGLSEMTGQVFANPADVSRRKQGSVGQPYRSDLRIVDENDKSLAIGEVGELEVRSPGLMLGYFDDPETTSKAIVDGWLRTGDLGLIDGDGFVFIRGRKKDIAIVGGKNISLREIDDAIYAFAGIELATSFGVPDLLGGERIIAIVQTSADTFDAVALGEFLKQELAPYKRPAEIHRTDEIPTGGSGKVLRSKSKARYLLDHGIDRT